MRNLNQRGSIGYCVAVAFAAALIATPVAAGFIEYGNENLLGTGTYPSDPKAGATLQGLAPGVSTLASTSFGHGFPFSPGPGDFPGTDQIYVGSVQTASHDGYSVSSQRINGPDVMTLDYSALVPAGSTVATLTLGIAADDFQFPFFGQPFIADLNGGAAPALTAVLESLALSGPSVRFFTIGLSPSLDNASHTLTVSINEGGDGGDGWAVDFLTLGVTTKTAPEPATIALLGVGLAGLGFARRRKMK